MSKYQKHPLIVGTLILTVTGLISRTMGFFYRIYLSRLFGEEGMGIYQLLNPVLALSFSFCAAGYQTAISKTVAEIQARLNQNKKGAALPMLAGLSISLPLSLLCCAVINFFADSIGNSLLQEPRTIPMLRIIAFSIPFSAVHACINGYFYGLKKAGVPAYTQLAEQMVRIGCVYFITAFAMKNNQAPSIAVAVWGLAIGELVSMLLAILSFYCHAGKESRHKYPDYSITSALSGIYGSILAMALPLTANRLVLNLLQSIESVSIPARLKAYGYDTTTALSVYGVLTGMAMPMIFFPNALTGSIAVMLLPIISENYALGNIKAVKEATLRTVKYCFLMGFACMLAFASLGNILGSFLFHSPLAGHFISTLGFICPFIYLDTTLSSILQGLGMAGQIFVINATCLLLRLCFVFFLIPKVGITGYLWGMLAGQLLLSLLYFICLYRFLQIEKGRS